jgi:hypothetical protein
MGLARRSPARKDPVVRSPARKDRGRKGPAA